jgi:hypothetical protein
MATSLPSVLIDGVTSIASHNGVSRVQCYRFGPDGKPETVIELLMTPAVAKTLIEALGKVR